jgi:hypothetical protein
VVTLAGESTELGLVHGLFFLVWGEESVFGCRGPEDRHSRGDLAGDRTDQTVRQGITPVEVDGNNDSIID